MEPTIKELDDLGARMKGYEAKETERRFSSRTPIYARIDGRGFSKFTKGMDKPYDAAMALVMVATTSNLVRATRASIGYTQSDEINLVWAPQPVFDISFFAGKVMKMTSVLASMAAAKFATICPDGYQSRMPHFDCRIMNLPDEAAAVDMILWRVIDCQRNGVLRVGFDLFSHRRLQNVSLKNLRAMIAEEGVDYEAYPENLRNGTFVRKLSREVSMTEEMRAKVPERQRAQIPLDAVLMRSEVGPFDAPPFTKIINRADFIFRGADAITEAA